MSVEAKLSRLSTDLKSAQSSRRPSKQLKQVSDLPDSWEEDDAADGDVPVEAPGPSLKQITSNDAPCPPPPTPISPSSSTIPASRWESLNGARESPRYTRETDERRPEKTTSTANRMIAGALGMKAPKKTEEQKQYDAAVRDAEIKRKNKEKEDKEIQRLEAEKAKAAIWDS